MPLMSAIFMHLSDCMEKVSQEESTLTVYSHSYNNIFLGKKHCSGAQIVAGSHEGVCCINTDSVLCRTPPSRRVYLCRFLCAYFVHTEVFEVRSDP